MSPPTKYVVSFFLTDPDGFKVGDAMVTLSGYGIQMTDAEGEASFAGVLPANDIIYSVSKTGFRDTINVLSVPDKDLDVTIVLKRDPGNPVLQVQDPGAFHIYPNPASDRIILESSRMEGRIYVFDLHGRMVLQRDLEGPIQKIDLKEWMPGIYYLRLVDKDGNPGVPVKFVVSKK
jgi:hypothetical protein